MVERRERWSRMIQAQRPWLIEEQLVVRGVDKMVFVEVFSFFLF